MYKEARRLSGLKMLIFAVLSLGCLVFTLPVWRDILKDEPPHVIVAGISAWVTFVLIHAFIFVMLIPIPISLMRRRPRR